MTEQTPARCEMSHDDGAPLALGEFSWSWTPAVWTTGPDGEQVRRSGGEVKRYTKWLCSNCAVDKYREMHNHGEPDPVDVVLNGTFTGDRVGLVASMHRGRLAREMGLR